MSDIIELGRSLHYKRTKMTEEAAIQELCSFFSGGGVKHRVLAFGSKILLRSTIYSAIIASLIGSMIISIITYDPQYYHIIQSYLMHNPQSIHNLLNAELDNAIEFGIMLGAPFALVRGLFDITSKAHDRVRTEFVRLYKM